jgi:[acyl-carrier-protein] S-malonyltransferase
MASEAPENFGKTAFVFPGQGSQSVGMGKALSDAHAAAREVFEEADDALGFSISRICFEGPEDQLTLTANTQPAILTASVAAFRAMEALGFPMPDFVAGHSLGEYSALVAAGGMGFADAVRTVRKRGLFMQEAVPVGEGAMAAIMKLPVDAVEEACRSAAGDGVCAPANINSPDQVVIAGSSSAVERAMEIAKEMGAKRAIRLNVSAPFHCSLMLPAQERLSEELGNLTFADLRFPLVENVSADFNVSGGRVRAALTEQVSSPVRWVESVEALKAVGAGTFVEVGPGKVLSGLVRQILGDVRCINVDGPETLESACAELCGPGKDCC